MAIKHQVQLAVVLTVRWFAPPPIYVRFIDRKSNTKQQQGRWFYDVLNAEPEPEPEPRRLPLVIIQHCSCLSPSLWTRAAFLIGLKCKRHRKTPANARKSRKTAINKSVCPQGQTRRAPLGKYLCSVCKQFDLIRIIACRVVKDEAVKLLRDVCSIESWNSWGLTKSFICWDCISVEQSLAKCLCIVVDCESWLNLFKSLQWK